MNVTATPFIARAPVRSVHRKRLAVLALPSVLTLAAKLALIASGLTAMGYGMAMCFTQFS